MLKFILLELVKSYAADEVPVKKTYSHLFLGVLFVVAFVCLACADYFYFYQPFNQESIIQNLLIISTILFLIAMFIKIFLMYLHRKVKRHAYSTANELQKIIMQLLPVAIRLAPVGIAGYLLWLRVRSKMGYKSFEWKKWLKHFS